MLNIRELTLNCLIEQSQGNVVSDMDGEKVMMNFQKGKYYNLGEVGGVIWDLIEKPIYIHKLIGKLTSEYNIEQADCERQVLSFLKSLYNEGLIQAAEGSNF